MQSFLVGLSGYRGALEVAEQGLPGALFSSNTSPFVLMSCKNKIMVFIYCINT